MLGTSQDGGKCCGKAIDEINPSTLGKTTSLKEMVVVVVIKNMLETVCLIICFHNMNLFT